MPRELRDLKVTKLSLVRKGYRPVNDGARITVVKAQEDSMADPTLAERIAKAVQSVLGTGVAKADAPVEVNSDGTHAAFSGQHAHDHKGSDGETHSEMHKHTDDASHDHDCSADMPVAKAEAEATPAAATDASAQIAGLTQQIATLTAELRTAQEHSAVVEKAIPTAEALQQIVDERLKAALEPIAKSVEDLAIQYARRAVTANVTDVIDPKKTSGTDQEARRKAVEKMPFGDAVRHLMHN